MIGISIHIMSRCFLSECFFSSSDDEAAAVVEVCVLVVVVSSQYAQYSYYFESYHGQRSGVNDKI